MGYLMNNKKLVHYAITMVLMFGFGVLPPIEPITPYGMQVLGVFLGAVYGWTTLNMLWPSLIGLVALGVQIGMTDVLARSIGTAPIAMLFIIYVLMGFMEECGATKVMATAILTNKLTNDRPWIFVFLMFFGAYACAQIQPIVAILLFLDFLRQVCNIFDIKKPSIFSILMALGIALGAMMGQLPFPFLNAGLTFNSAYQSMTNTILPTNEYVLFNIPMHLVLLIAYTTLMKFVFKVDLSKLQNISSDVFGEKELLTAMQKISFLGIGAFLLLALGAAFLPREWAVIVFLNKLTIFGQIGIVVSILMILVHKNGEPLIDFNKLISKNLPWDVIMLTALILALSSYVGLPETGISAALALLMQPVVNLSPWVFIIVVLLAATIATNFMNNIVVVVIIMPMIIGVMSGMSGGIAIPTEGIMMLLFIVSHLAILTPAASLYVGICFATQDLVEAKTLMKYAAIIVPLMLIITLAIGIPYSMIIF